MDWLQSLLWDPSSVAHIVLLYAFVVAAGVYLGNCCRTGALLPLERPGRTADDGRYPLRSSDKYSGTWCCQ